MKWNVQGYLRLGMFTKRNIEKVEEFALDYRLEKDYSTTKTEWYFKSPKFRRVLEVKSKSNKNADEEKLSNRKMPSKNKAVAWKSIANKVAKKTLSKHANELR